MTTVLDRFAPVEERYADRLNPILLRELRQMSRNRFVITLVIGLLATCFALSSAYLLIQVGGQAVSMQNWRATDLGRGLLYLLLPVLAGCMLVMIPLFVAIRFGWERSEKHLDLMYISTLEPREIVVAKLQSALHLAMLSVAVCLPFLALTYRLRGVDFWEIVGAIVVLILHVFNWTLFFMLLAVIRTRLIRAFLLAIIGPLWLFTCVSFLGDPDSLLSVFGRGLPVGGWFVWGLFCLVAYAGLIDRVSPTKAYRYSWMSDDDFRRHLMQEKRSKFDCDTKAGKNDPA